jgi:hypothetical protein
MGTSGDSGISDKVTERRITKMNYKVSERLEQTDENRKWPWDWRKGKEALTDTASEEIVKNLALYANDAMYRKPEEVGMSNSLSEGFLHYCFHVKENFIKAAKKYPKSKVSEIVEEALRLIDRFVSIAEYPTKDNTCSWLELISQWDTVVRKLDMCVGSGGQQEEPAEPDSPQSKIGFLQELVPEEPSE